MAFEDKDSRIQFATMVADTMEKHAKNTKYAADDINLIVINMQIAIAKIKGDHPELRALSTIADHIHTVMDDLKRGSAEMMEVSRQTRDMAKKISG